MRITPPSLHKLVKGMRSAFQMSNFWPFSATLFLKRVFLLIFLIQVVLLEGYANDPKNNETDEEKKTVAIEGLELIKKDCIKSTNEFKIKFEGIIEACEKSGFIKPGQPSAETLRTCQEKYAECASKTDQTNKGMIATIKRFKDGKLDDPKYAKSEDGQLKKAAYDAITERYKRTRSAKKRELPISPEKKTRHEKEAAQILEDLQEKYVAMHSGGGEGIFAGQSYSIDKDDYDIMDEVMVELEKKLGICTGFKGSKAADIKSLLEIQEKKRDRLKEEKSKLQDLIKDLDEKIDENKDRSQELLEENTKIRDGKEESFDNIKTALSKQKDEYGKFKLESYKGAIDRKRERLQITAKIESEIKTIRVTCDKSAQNDLTAWVAQVKYGRIKISPRERYSFLSHKIKKQYQYFYDQCIREASAKIAHLEVELKNLQEATRDYDNYYTVMLDKNGEVMASSENQATSSIKTAEQKANQALVNNYQKQMQNVDSAQKLQQSRADLSAQMFKKEQALEIQDFAVDDKARTFENALNAGDQKADFEKMTAIGSLEGSREYARGQCQCLEEKEEDPQSKPTKTETKKEEEIITKALKWTQDSIAANCKYLGDMKKITNPEEKKTDIDENGEKNLPITQEKKEASN